MSEQASASNGGPAVPVPHPMGTLVVIVGILSLFCCGVVLGPVAIYLATTAQRDVTASPGAFSNASMLQAGKVLGIVGTVMGIVTSLLVLRWLGDSWATIPDQN